MLKTQPHPQQDGDGDLHSDVPIKELALHGVSMVDSQVAHLCGFRQTA